MRFIADQSLDFAGAGPLCTAGRDVLAVAETHSGADDDLVIERAVIPPGARPGYWER